MSKLIPIEWKSSDYIQSLTNNDLLTNTALTFNSHGWCLAESTFRENKQLSDFFDLTALSKGNNLIFLIIKHSNKTFQI